MAKTARGTTDSIPTTPEASKTIEATLARPTEEEIAVRAYHIYLERGGAEGNPSDDWLQAERELAEGQ
jgi:hypothetical protein